MKIPQIHFEMSEWQQAFDFYFKNKDLYDDVIFILSKNPYVEGYWIESKSEVFSPDPDTFVYEGDEVNLLKERIVEAISNGTKKHFII